jgi:LAS superfamily LD-carboxypeptidase LdcB
MSCKNINVTQERQERRPAEAAEYRVLNGFGETQPGVAFPVGQTLGQTASFRQTAPETWCQSRVCGVLDTG